MELERIIIERNSTYAPRPNEFSGKLKFCGSYGDVEIALDAKLSQEVLALVAVSLTRATKEIAEQLTASVFENASKALEHKE